jgi:hypothetical protein
MPLKPRGGDADQYIFTNRCCSRVLCGSRILNARDRMRTGCGDISESNIRGPCG